MTFDEMIERIKNHNEIHSKKERQAVLITEALNKAIDLLKNQRWHYPSKGELPEIVCGSEFVLIVTKTVYDNIKYHIGFYSKELGFYKVNEKLFKNEPIHSVIAWKPLRYDGDYLNACS